MWDPLCRPQQRRPPVLQTNELREENLLLSPQLVLVASDATRPAPHRGYGAVDSVTKVPPGVCVTLPLPKCGTGRFPGLTAYPQLP